MRLVGNSEILVGDPFLSKGMTFVHFSLSGKVPRVIESLKVTGISSDI